jgi:cytochrome c peroxidase
VKKYLGVISLISLFVFIGCRKSDLLSYDQDLYNALNRASGGRGLSYYLLPNSDDYNSIPNDPNNPLTAAKVELGKLLFHETQLSGNPKLSQGMYTYSCASCHQAKAGFQSGLAQGLGEGGAGYGTNGSGRVPSLTYILDSIDTQPLRSPSILNAAFQEAMLWNGQFGATGVNANTQSAWTHGTPKEMNKLGYEGLETQAIAGISVHRLKIDTAWLVSKLVYKILFDQAFADKPQSERITNITAGLAIAAYERTVLANQSPFQLWLKGDNNAMTLMERNGAIVFFGKGKCYTCHNGPALNSMSFYAIGANDMQNGHDGCININANQVEHKGRGGFTGNPEDMYKFKVPQLYNLKDVNYFGHGASFTSVEEVVNYKNAAIPQNKNVPARQIAKEFTPLHLDNNEVKEIVEFIKNGLYDPSLSKYVPKSLPSGNCFPNNDTKSRLDMGWH